MLKNEIIAITLITLTVSTSLSLTLATTASLTTLTLGHYTPFFLVIAFLLPEIYENYYPRLLSKINTLSHN